MKITTFKIDVENPSDLKKHITLLQRTRKNLLRNNCNFSSISFGSSKQNLYDIMPIFEFLLNIKYIPILGSDVVNQNNKEYYVYLHCDPTNHIKINRDIRELLLASNYGLSFVPFYVGKGTGNRCFDLNRNDSHRKIRSKILKSNKDIEVVKIKENLSENEALFEEQKLIAILGLISLHKTGMLVNLQTDNSILKRFIEEMPNFKVPNNITSIHETAEARILSKYENFIKLISTWI